MRVVCVQCYLLCVFQIIDVNEEFSSAVRTKEIRRDNISVWYLQIDSVCVCVCVCEGHTIKIEGWREREGDIREIKRE